MNNISPKLFYRLCIGLTDIGELFPITVSPYNLVKNLDQEVFRSVYLYSQEQYEEANKQVEVVNKRTGEVYSRPRGVGILTLADGTQLDTIPGITNQLIFDFDCKDDLDKAKSDTIEVVSRLKKWGISGSAIDTYFSGGKGFNIKVHLNQFLNSSELQSICSKLIDGLDTADTVVYNDSRIVRLPYSKHGKSGLYCTPITLDELVNLKIDDIKAIAATKFQPEEFPTRIDIPEELLKLKDLKVSEKKKVETKIIGASFEDMKDKISKLDFSKKMPLMSAAKWVLQQGFIPAGHGQEARMILAATYKAMGLDENEAYYQLKATSKKRVKLLGKAYEFDKSELWTNVIATVYSDNWQGGTYSADHPLLATIEQYIPSFLRSPKESQSNITTKDEAFAQFVDYSREIDQNTIRFGIELLDRHLRVMTKNVYGILGPPSVGKCHTKGTEVLMYNGDIKKVEDIVVGDLLMGNDSTPRKVLSLARGREECFNVVPESGGKSYGVNKSHILSLKSTVDGEFKGVKRGDIVNISVNDYLTKSKNFKKRIKSYRNKVEFSNQDVKFDPYLIGLWIGDGTLTKPSITTVDIEIQEYLKKYCNDNGFTLSIHDIHRAPSYNITTKQGRSRNVFYDYIREINQSGEKRIPEIYLKNSSENRLKLLAGIIDSDGHKVRESTYEVTTKYKILSEQISYLAYTLGLNCSVTEKYIVYKGEQRLYYRVNISGDLTNLPCLLPRKRSVKPTSRNNGIMSFKLESLGEQDYYGFELDGNHLYCLSDCTVTHNTSIILQILENTSRDGIKAIYFSFDMSNDDTIEKIMVRHTGLDGEHIMARLKSGDEDFKKTCMSILNKHYQNVEFVFKPGLTVEDMENTIRLSDRMSGKPTKLIVVDYLTLIKSSAGDANGKTIEAIQGMRYLAHALNVASVPLLQPNKLNATPDEPITSYNGIKGSSEIAEACTAVITAYREGFSPTNYDNDKFLGLICVKNRKGKLFNLDFNWEGKTGMIRGLTDSEKHDLKKLREAKAAKKAEEKNVRNGGNW